MLLVEFIAGMPWWAFVFIGVLAVISGLLNVVQLYKSRDAVRWKSASDAAAATAAAAISERDILRLKRDHLLEENKELINQVAVLKAKTDLAGLKAEMVKSMQDLREELKKHSDQDSVVAREHAESWKAVNESLKALREARK